MTIRYLDVWKPVSASTIMEARASFGHFDIFWPLSHSSEVFLKHGGLSINVNVSKCPVYPWHVLLSACDFP